VFTKNKKSKQLSLLLTVLLNYTQRFCVWLVAWFST